MKFSLKQLILFVTVAAILCGAIAYSIKEVQKARRMAVQARLDAQRMALQTKLKFDKAKWEAEDATVVSA